MAQPLTRTEAARQPDPLSQLVRDAVFSALQESAEATQLKRRLLDREGAAEYLSVEPSTIDRLFHQRKLPRVVLTAKVFRYDVKDLDAYLEQSKET